VIVIDTNLIVQTVLPSDAHAVALEVAARDPAWVAPSLWRSELRNVLATSMRVRGLKLRDAVAAFEAADQLVTDFDVDGFAEACLALAAKGRISGYDAEFVFAAERLGKPLVSSDRRLAKAFPGRVLSPEEFVARG
jgi:predicted nucleic acid-binding protein